MSYYRGQKKNQNETNFRLGKLNNVKIDKMNSEKVTFVTIFLVDFLSFQILAFGAIAISQSSEVHEQKVLIQSAPTHVVVARPVPITVAEIIENAKGLVAAEEENVPIAEEKVIESPDDEGTKITKRWWKDESPPAPPPAPMVCILLFFKHF